MKTNKLTVALLGGISLIAVSGMGASPARAACVLSDNLYVDIELPVFGVDDPANCDVVIDSGTEVVNNSETFAVFIGDNQTISSPYSFVNNGFINSEDLDGPFQIADARAGGIWNVSENVPSTENFVPVDPADPDNDGVIEVWAQSAAIQIDPIPITAAVAFAKGIDHEHEDGTSGTSYRITNGVPGSYNEALIDVGVEVDAIGEFGLVGGFGWAQGTEQTHIVDDEIEQNVVDMYNGLGSNVSASAEVDSWVGSGLAWAGGVTTAVDQELSGAQFNYATVTNAGELAAHSDATAINNGYYIDYGRNNYDVVLDDLADSNLGLGLGAGELGDLLYGIEYNEIAYALSSAEAVNQSVTGLDDDGEGGILASGVINNFDAYGEHGVMTANSVATSVAGADWESYFENSLDDGYGEVSIALAEAIVADQYIGEAHHATGRVDNGDGMMAATATADATLYNMALEPNDGSAGESTLTVAHSSAVGSSQWVQAEFVDAGGAHYLAGPSATAAFINGEGGVVTADAKSVATVWGNNLVYGQTEEIFRAVPTAYHVVANAEATGSRQLSVVWGPGGLATNEAINDGLVMATADAEARRIEGDFQEGENQFQAFGNLIASAETKGINQNAYALDEDGVASSTLWNSSTGDIYAMSTAEVNTNSLGKAADIYIGDIGYNDGYAPINPALAMTAATGIEQTTIADISATDTVYNDGSVDALSVATIDTDLVDVYEGEGTYSGFIMSGGLVEAIGVDQIAGADEFASASLFNSSGESIRATGLAHIDGIVGSYADVFAAGAAQSVGFQFGVPEFGEALTHNTGLMDAYGEAIVSSTKYAAASGTVLGVVQGVTGDYAATALVFNGEGGSGDIIAYANIEAYSLGAPDRIIPEPRDAVAPFGALNSLADVNDALNGILPVEEAVIDTRDLYGDAYGADQFIPLGDTFAAYGEGTVIGSDQYAATGEGFLSLAVTGNHDNIDAGLNVLAEVELGPDGRWNEDGAGAFGYVAGVDQLTERGFFSSAIVFNGPELLGDFGPGGFGGFDGGEAMMGQMAEMAMGYYPAGPSIYGEGSVHAIGGFADAFITGYGVRQQSSYANINVPLTFNTSYIGAHTDATAQALGEGDVLYPGLDWLNLGQQGSAWATAVSAGVSQEASGFYSPYDVIGEVGLGELGVVGVGVVASQAALAAIVNTPGAVIEAEAYAAAAGETYNGAQAFDAEFKSFNSSVYGEALAGALGTYQDVAFGELGVAAVINLGDISGHADSLAVANYAYSDAIAAGSWQAFSSLGEATALVYNGPSATMWGTSVATADDDAYANSEAYGYVAQAQGFIYETPSEVPFAVFDVGEVEINTLESLTLNVFNEGVIAGESYASGIEDTYSTAKGIYAHTTSFESPYQFPWDAEIGGETELTGVIWNSPIGVIAADAYGIATTEAGEAAEVSAIGIHMESNTNTTHTKNEGLVYAMAAGVGILDNGGYASATGIRINDAGDPSGQGEATISNYGGIIFAGQSYVDAGEAAFVYDYNNIYRGNAIHTLYAPNDVEINWLGINKKGDVQDGYIAGHVMISKDDEINVTDGWTFLDGNVNSEGEMNGSLDIYNNGKLVLVKPDWEDGATWPGDRLSTLMYEPKFGYGEAGYGGEYSAYDYYPLPEMSPWMEADASRVYVDHFHVGETGTLALQLTNSTAKGDYGQVFADRIELDEGSTISAQYEAGIYDDNFIYGEVLQGGDITGQFTNVVDNSALLLTEAAYYDDNDDYMNLEVERIGFGEVGGLSDNEQAVGDAIENVYNQLNPGDEDDFTNLVKKLFVLNDEDYPEFLKQLTGAEHAQLLQSTLWSTRAIQRIVSERMACSGANMSNGYTQVDGVTLQENRDPYYRNEGCFEPNKAHMWARVFGNWNKHDGDDNAPGYSEDQIGALFGGDYSFGSSWFAGMAAGYFKSDMDFKDWGGRPGSHANYDGWQIAGYGGYDNGDGYLRSSLAYGNYTGETKRLIQYGPSPIDPYANTSADTLSVYGEAGYRFLRESLINLTPFVGVSFATAELDSYTEKDPEGTGARLAIHDSSADSLELRVGGRLTGNIDMGAGVFTPEAMVAWAHEFEDTTQAVKMSFADAPEGADFTVVSAKTPRDSVLVDAGGRFNIGETFDLGLYYSGRLNEEYQSHAVTGRLGIKF